jgi:RNA polymerase II subunit A-like phosphatase
MDPPTPLSLPSNLPYPIIISRLLSSPDSYISRGTRLLEYSFTSDTSRHALGRARRKGEHEGGSEKKDADEARENDMVGTWDSPVEGTLVQWEEGVKAGMRIEKRHAR